MSTATLDIPRRLLRDGERSLSGRLRVFVSSVVAGLLGLLPHVLHHAGPLAGAALFAGTTGSLLFGAVGLVAAIPFLLRVRRHCGNWRMPAATLAAMAAVFSLSTFIVGPAIAGDDNDDGGGPQQVPAGHEAHH